jgi:hypothetical protein
LGEFVAPPGLSPERLDWLVYVLKHYGVSETGADQFTRAAPVTDAADRKALLQFVNRVVVQGSGRPAKFQGKMSH